MFLDLDRFKLINDSLGHAIGDRLLKAIGDRLRSTVRASDVVARFGGDEFAIMQTDLTQASGTVALARKLLAVIAEPITLDTQQINTTASLGITIFPNDESDPEQLLRNADLAMYRAKRDGRNRYELYSPAMNEEIQSRSLMERDLRHALEHHEFILHYQPEINQKTRRIIGAEALLRWHHPARGMVSPGGVHSRSRGFRPDHSPGRVGAQRGVHSEHGLAERRVAPICVSVNASPIQFLRTNVVENRARCPGELRP